MAVHASGKIHLTTNPALPATCAVCNKSANASTKFIDFQRDLDYYGAVVICEDCVRESLELLDCVPVARAIEAETELISLRETVLELEENNVRLNATLDSLLVLRPSLRSDSTDSTESDNSSAETNDSGFEDSKSGLFE